MARSSTKRGSLYADLDNLRATFASLDPDNTGYIGYQELKTLAQSESSINEAMLPELLETLDRDNDGKVSFEDVQALFELERESIKRQKLEKAKHHSERETSLGIAADISCNNEEYESALDTTPSEVSPASPEESNSLYHTPAVVLRHKKKLRLPTGEQSGSNDREVSMLSPIKVSYNGNAAPLEPDLATQMRYLTNIPESPKLNRRSKVLSWISESEDMFEDTGVSREHADGLLSPPMSPGRGCGDEAAHVRSVLEGVCQSKDIGRDAVKSLCSHVQADKQEEEELLALLDHLDKQKKGYVSIDEFVYGLQSMRNSASVASIASPSSVPTSRSCRHSEMEFPKLSEPFSTPNSGKRAFAHHSSTPLPPLRKQSIYGDSPQLSVLDPNNSGFVGVESLAHQWQRMGVEPPHNQSLEDALKESLPVDAARRVSMSEVTTSLETAVLNDDKKNTTFRQAALLTFKGEINQLRNQLIQMSMEKDGLQSTLQRTTEENKRLVQEGDEQVERITRESERRARENEHRLIDRIREIEHEKEEEAKRLQELIDLQKEKHKREIENLKSKEERLKMELKLAQNEAKRSRHQEKEELLGGNRVDHGDRMEMDQVDSNGMRIRMEELELANADRLEQSKHLQEYNTSLQDRVDELSAEIERLKHKHTSHRRKQQRQQSEPRRLNSASLSASRLEECRTSRPHSAKRPSSASRKTTAPSRLALISETNAVDIHKGYSDASSPVRSPELCYSDGGTEGTMESEVNEIEFDQEESDITPVSSEDGLFAKSTASLLEEMQFEDTKADIQRELEQLRRENNELEESCHIMEQQLQRQHDQSVSEQKRQLDKRRQRQEELERRIRVLEKQQKNLTNTKHEIDLQLASTEDSLAKQLNEIHTLRDKLSNVTSQSSQSQTEMSQDVMDNFAETDPEEHLHDLNWDRRELLLGSEQHLEVIKCEVEALKAEKMMLIADHKDELEQIAKANKQKYQEIEDEQNITLKRLRKELHSSQLALEQYKNDAQSLEVQLQKSKQEIKAKERELELLQNRPQRKVLPVVPSQTQRNEEIEELRKENRSLHQNLQERVAEFQSLHEALFTNEVSYEAQLKAKEYEYQREQEKREKDAKYRASSIQERIEKELVSTKTRCDIQVESVQQLLKGSQLTTEQFKRKLESAEKQCETLLLDLSQQKVTVTTQANQIAELKEIQLRLHEQISHAKQDRQKEDAKCAEKTNMEQKLHSEIERLQCQLRKNSDREEALIEESKLEEVDYSLERISPITSPSRHSYQSDYSYHEDIVTQMKSQLVDLQTCLIQQQNSLSKSNELTLVQELLETNAILQANLEREQKERMKELATLDAKDSSIECLTEKVEEKNQQLVNLKTNFLEEALECIQQRSEASISTSSSKVSEASTAILKVIEVMRKRHINAQDSELHQAQIVQDEFQQEVKKLHSTLDREFAQTERELKESLHSKECEVKELRELLEEASESLRSLRSQGDDLLVDTICEKEESDSGLLDEKEVQGMITESDKEIKFRALQEEVKRAMNSHQNMTDTIRNDMKLKEKEISCMEAQIYAKEQEIQELQHKLQTVVQEPVEVIQYVEAAPLESVSDAVFTSMQKDLKAGRQQSVQLETQHKVEVDKLKKELDHSKSECMELKQQVYALKQAVQEQEAELRATLEKREAERRQREFDDQKNRARFLEMQHGKSSSTKSALEKQLRDVCRQLVPLPPETEKIDYGDLAKRAQEQIAVLFHQLSEEQTLRHELELSMGESQAEWQVQESQWQMEHEEEVRALRQRNSQLLQMLEDTRSHYQEYIAEQERENAEFVQELIAKQSSLEKELEIRTEEHDHAVSIQEVGTSKERSVLVDIIKQLCSTPFDFS